MKKLFVAATVLLLTACNASHQAFYVDSEFGQSTQATFDQQVAFPNNPHEGKTPEDLQGVTAEELMKTYTEMFSKSCEKSNVFTLDFTNSNSSD